MKTCIEINTEKLNASTARFMRWGGSTPSPDVLTNDPSIESIRMPPSTSAKMPYLRFPDEALQRKMLDAVRSPSSLTEGLNRAVSRLATAKMNAREILPVYGFPSPRYSEPRSGYM